MPGGRARARGRSVAESIDDAEHSATIKRVMAAARNRHHFSREMRRLSARKITTESAAEVTPFLTRRDSQTRTAKPWRERPCSLRMGSPRRIAVGVAHAMACVASAIAVVIAGGKTTPPATHAVRRRAMRRSDLSAQTDRRELPTDIYGMVRRWSGRGDNLVNVGCPRGCRDSEAKRRLPGRRDAGIGARAE